MASVWTTVLIVGLIAAAAWACSARLARFSNRWRLHPAREAERETRHALREQIALKQELETLLERIEHAAAAATRELDSRLAQIREIGEPPSAARLEEAPPPEPQPAPPPSALRTTSTPQPRQVAASAVRVRRIEDVSPMHASVCEMAGSGKRPMQIAEALDLPLGEVELILSLRAAE